MPSPESPGVDILVAPRGDRAELRLQRRFDMRRDQTVDIAAECRHFANQARANERVARRGHQADNFDFGCEMVVHMSQLELILKIRDGPEAANDGAGTQLASILY